jgi:hypothetical protein
MVMKRFLALFMACVVFLTACGSNSSAESSKTDNQSNENQTELEGVVSESEVEEQTENRSDETEADEIESDDTLPIEETIDDASNDMPISYSRLNDPELLQYMQDSIYANLESGFENEDYIIENVSAIYYSKEYLEELEYNSQSNIFFGYTLKELDQQFQGTRYIFTLDDNGETIVKPFEDYDDTYDRIIKNVATGTGVILICVTVSVVTGGAGLAPVSMIFAASAKTGTAIALSSGVFSGVAAGVVKGIQTGDLEEAAKAAALTGSESFKWGAITGAIAGGISEASVLRNASDGLIGAEEVTTAPKEVHNWRESEKYVQEFYNVDKTQVSFLNGQEVPMGTPDSTRPDLIRRIGDHMEAIEVKNYDLSNYNNRKSLYSVLKKQIANRVKNLPDGTTQRIVIDVTGRDVSPRLLKVVKDQITKDLIDIYPSIPIDIIGGAL